VEKDKQSEFENKTVRESRIFQKNARGNQGLEMEKKNNDVNRNSYEIMAKVYEQRTWQEIEFVSSLVSGIHAGSVRASDIIAVCPPYLLTPGTKQYGIYHAISALAEKGEIPTIVKIYEYICKEQPKNRSDIPTLKAEDIADFSLSIFGGKEDSILFYANNVRREGLKRRAETKLVELVGDCNRYGNDPTEIATCLQHISTDLEGGAAEEYTLDDALDRTIATLESGEAAKPLPTPWTSLNKVLKGGVAPGELVILAARPGVGKTAFAGCFAVDAAKNNGKSVLFVSREVTEYTMVSRFLAREGKLDLRLFRQGIENAPNLLPKLHIAKQSLSGLPLRLVEKSIAPLGPREIRRLTKTTKGIGLLVIDYLQLLTPDTQYMQREREISEMSRAMKQLALDCEIPVLLLSQLNREVEKTNRKPQLSDLRESGAIEQDADIVIFLHTEKDALSSTAPQVLVNVAKGRSSGTGFTFLRFEKTFADFVEDRMSVWNNDNNPNQRA
jgi:replicative DNA helicase